MDMTEAGDFAAETVDSDYEDGFQELSFDDEEDSFMAEFRGMPELDEVAGARQNPFLRIAYGRKLLDYEQERELGRRLGESREAMTVALSAFSPCIGHLIAEWDKAVLGQRSPGEVLQWPAGGSDQPDEESSTGRKSSPARRKMASLSLTYGCWRSEVTGAPPLEAPLDQRSAFVDVAPAFSMLCELKALAREALDAAPADEPGREGLECALQQAAAAELRFQEARRVMLESNLRLVFSIAGKFVNNGVGYDDLVQEGSIGLLRAIEKFEPAMGFKFSTYASTWIWQAVTRAIANQRRTVRVPAHIHDKMLRVRSLAAQFRQRTGREPTLGELSEESDLSPDVVQRALNASNRTLSLDAPVRTGEEDTSFLDLTPDRGSRDASETVHAGEVWALVRGVLRELPEREARILNLRLGMDGTEPLTLEEIGGILGITRERTRQLQNRGLAVLRERLKDLAGTLTS